MATVANPVKATSNAKTDAFVHSQIAKAQRRIRGLDLLTALLGFIGGTLAFGLLMAVFNAREMSTPVLIGAFCVYAVAALAYLAMTIVRPMLRHINPYFAARKVEETVPEAKNSVVNWLDLHEDKRLPGAIQTALSQRAARDLSKVDIDQAVSARRIGWAASFAGIMAFLFIIALFTFGASTLFAQLGRTFFPFAAAEGPRTTIEIISPKGGNLTISDKENEVEIRVRIDGKEPDSVKLLFWTANEEDAQEDLLEPVQRNSSDYSLTLPRGKIKNNKIFYRVVAGNAETNVHWIAVRISPLVETPFLRTTYLRPAYLRPVTPYFKHTPVKAEFGKRAISDYAGTRVTFDVPTNRTLKDGAMLVTLQDEKGKNVTVNGKAVEKTIRAEIDPAAPQRLRFNFTLDEQDNNGLYTITYTSTEGEVYEESVPSPIRVVRDAAPVVKWSPLENQIPAGNAEWKPTDIEQPLNEPLALAGFAIDGTDEKGEVGAGNPEGVRSITLFMQMKDGAKLQAKPYRAPEEIRLANGMWPHRLEYRDFVDLTQVKDAEGKPVQLKEKDVLEIWLEARDACDYPAGKEGNAAQSVVRKVTILAPKKDEKTDEEKKKEAEQKKQEHKKKQDEENKKEAEKRKDEARKEQQRQDEEKAKQEKNQRDANGEQGANNPENKNSDKKEGKPKNENSGKDDEAKKNDENIKKEIEKNERERDKQKGEGKDDKEKRGEGKGDPDKNEGKGGEQANKDDKKGEGKGKAENQPEPGKEGAKGKEGGEGQASKSEGKGGQPEMNPQGQGKDGMEAQPQPGQQTGQGKDGKESTETQPNQGARAEGKDGKPEKGAQGKEGPPQDNQAAQGKNGPPQQGDNQGQGKGGANQQPDKRAEGKEAGKEQGTQGAGKGGDPQQGQQAAQSKDSAAPQQGGGEKQTGRGKDDRIQGEANQNAQKPATETNRNDVTDAAQDLKSKDPVRREEARQRLEDIQRNSRDGDAREAAKQELDKESAGNGAAEGKKPADPKQGEQNAQAKEGPPAQENGKTGAGKNDSQAAQGKQGEGKGAGPQGKEEKNQSGTAKGRTAGDKQAGQFEKTADRAQGAGKESDAEKQQAQKEAAEQLKKTIDDLKSADPKRREEAANTLRELKRRGESKDKNPNLEKTTEQALPEAIKQALKDLEKDQKSDDPQKRENAENAAKELSKFAQDFKDKMKPEQKQDLANLDKIWTGSRAPQLDAKPVEVVEDKGDGRHHAKPGALQLQKFSDTVKKRILDKAGVTPEQYSEALDWIKRNPPKDEEGTASREKPKSLPTTGIGSVKPGSDGKGPGGADVGAPPREYQDAYKEFTDLINKAQLNKQKNKK